MENIRIKIFAKTSSLSGAALLGDNYNFRKITGSNSTSGGGVDDAKKAIGRDDNKGKASDAGEGNGAGAAGNAGNAGGLGGGNSGGMEGTHLVGTKEDKEETDS